MPLLAGARKDPFIIVNGDVWTEYPLVEGVKKFAAADVAHFVLVPNPDFHTRGDFGLAEGRVVDEGERYTYANIGVFRPEFFADCQPGRFPLAPLMFDGSAKIASAASCTAAPGITSARLNSCSSSIRKRQPNVAAGCDRRR